MEQYEREHLNELREKMAANEQEHESFRRRLKEHDERIVQINDLTLAVQRQGDVMERVVDAQQKTQQSIDRVEKRVVDLEREPADRWRKLAFEIIKWAVIGTLGLIAGYVLGR